MNNSELNYQKSQLINRLYNDIAEFGTACFPDAFSKASPPAHKEIFDMILNTDNRRVLIAAPRGFAKSTIMSFLYPMYRIAFKKSNEPLFIIIVSESKTQSANFINRIKDELNNSELFKELFGDLSESTASRWREDEVVLANGTRVVAKGAGQSLRGLIHNNSRPNLIVIDDFESEKNAYTKEARAKNRNWITEALVPSLSDDGRIVMIGTVISEDCFLFNAKNSTIWKVLWFTILDEDGNSIWKEKFPLSRIADIKKEFEETGRLGGFYQEYMNLPQSPDEAPFQPSYIKRHTYYLKVVDGINYLVNEAMEDNIDKFIPVSLYMGIDPASSLSRTADYFVIAVMATDSDMNRYIVDLLRAKLNPADQPQAILDMYMKYKPLKTTIETVGYQEALRANVKRLSMENNVYIPGLERGFKPRSAKNERLLSLVPPLARGKFFFRPEDIYPPQEFLAFPKGKHDDVIDAIWMALSKAKPHRIKKRVDKNVNIEFNRFKEKIVDWMTI